MLRLSLRGQGGAPATLLSGREHSHKERVGWRAMGSERWEMSVTSLLRAGERSLVDGDEFQSLRKQSSAGFVRGRSVLCIGETPEVWLSLILQQIFM